MGSMQLLKAKFTTKFGPLVFMIYSFNRKLGSSTLMRNLFPPLKFDSNGIFSYWIMAIFVLLKISIIWAVNVNLVQFYPFVITSSTYDLRNIGAKFLENISIIAKVIVNTDIWMDKGTREGDVSISIIFGIFVCNHMFPHYFMASHLTISWKDLWM